MCGLLCFPLCQQLPCYNGAAGHFLISPRFLGAAFFDHSHEVMGVESKQKGRGQNIDYNGARMPMMWLAFEEMVKVKVPRG